jgi:cytochrome c-type biogenesis protein CcmH/NrfG
MRHIIRQKLQAGESVNAIRDYFVAKYGPWILLAPPVSGVGAVVWLGPPLLIAVGLCLLVYLAYQWKRRRPPRLERETSRRPEDVRLALARLDDLVDENVLTETEYRSQRGRLSRALAEVTSQSATSTVDRRGKTWLQAGVMVVMALLIAVSVTLAIQPRGTGPITGSAISSSAPPATPPALASIPRDIRAAINRVVASPKSAAAWNGLGAVLLLHRKYSQAADAYHNSLRLDSQNDTANLGLAFINIGNGKNKAALRELNVVMSQDPRSSRLWLLLGLTYSKLPGETRRAVVAWSRFLRLSPNNSLAGQVRGWMRALQHGQSAP